MLKKILTIVVVVALAAGLLAGCGNGATPTTTQNVETKAEETKAEETKAEETEAEETKAEETEAEVEANTDTKKLGLLTYSLGEEFGVDTLTGANAAAEKLGYEIVAPDPAGDLQKQISQLEDMIQQKVAAIIIAPIDAYAIVPHLQKAIDAGIPVVNYDIIADMETCDAIIFSDNLAGGNTAGEEIINAIGKEGKVLILEDNPGVVVIEQRCQGVVDYITENAPDIEIVKQVSNGTRDTHQKTTENMLTAHPDLAAIFAPDGDHTLGAYAACKQMGKDNVKVVGYDASPEQIDIMKKDGADGILLASIAQFPIALGRICVETADKVIKGELEEREIIVPLGIAQAATIDEFKFME